MCVGLVSTNRQDIQLSLFGENRLKAQLSAQSGLNQALAYMRSHSDWESKFQSGLEGDLACGAHWKAKVSQYNGSISPPHPYLKLTSQGTCGSVSIEKSTVVEEFRLGDSVATTGQKPHLFGIGRALPSAVEDILLMLGPSFQWRPVQAPPDGNLPTFGCDGGPLAGLRKLEASPDPPEIKDWRVSQGSFGFYNYLFETTGVVLPKCPKLVILDIVGSTMSWKPKPQANNKLAKLGQATIDDNPNGQPRIEVVLTPAGPITVDISDHKGPVVEWWEILSQRVMTSPNGVYCLANHHIYQGVHAKNIISSSGGVPINTGFFHPSKFRSALGVLKFESQSQSWVVACDSIHFDWGSWQIVQDLGPQPKAITAALAGDSVFALDNNDAQSILAAEPGGWRSKERNPSGLPTLLSRSGKIEPMIISQEPSNTRRYQIRGTEKLEKSLPTSVPALTANIGDSSGAHFESRTAIQGQSFDWTLNPALGHNVSAADETFSIANLNYSSFAALDSPAMVPPITPAPLQTKVLLHYDGHIWQALPQGALAAVWDPARYPVTPEGFSINDPGGSNYYVSRLVGLAAYQTQANLMRRYAPLVFP